MIRIGGIAETRRCGAVAVRSQVITWSSALTLYALYLSRPLPPPSPRTSSALSFSGSVLITTLVHSYTWYTGVSQNNFLRQKYLASIFQKKSFQPPFFLPLDVRTFLQHLFAKNAFLLHHSMIRESFPVFSFVAVFSPFLNECQLFMPKDFLEPPCLTPLGVSLVYGRGRGETDNEV